jgi:4-methylaminobutanoate oxidase (formaldehyde-forming)
MLDYTRSPYRSQPTGFIELAADKDRLEEYRRISAINRKHGVDVHEITPQEVQKLFPLCSK